MCACARVRVHTFICTRRCLQLSHLAAQLLDQCILLCMRACVRACVCMHVHMSVHVFACVRAFVRTHAHVEPTGTSQQMCPVFARAVRSHGVLVHVARVSECARACLDTVHACVRVAFTVL